MIVVAVFALGIAGYVWRRDAEEREQAIRVQLLLRAYRPNYSEALAFLLAAQRASVAAPVVPPACWRIEVPMRLPRFHLRSLMIVVAVTGVATWGANIIHTISSESAEAVAVKTYGATLVPLAIGFVACVMFLATDRKS
jgi:hypothetical protein